MKEKIKIFIGILMLGITVSILAVISMLKQPEEFSDSERRKLKQQPEWNLTTFLNTGYSEEFEDFAMDQFPFRDYFRRLKSFSHYYLFGQKDNNGIYIEDGYAAKLNYPLNEESIENALKKFRFIYDTYLSEHKLKVYSSVIPDKGFYLAKQNGYPSLDYKALFSMVQNGMDFAGYIDISNSLTIEDYYKTDTHWRQEKIKQVAEEIAKNMGFNSCLSNQYEEVTTKVPFVGVYSGQSALPLKSETIKYLTNELIEKSKVFNYETGEVAKVYTLNKLNNKDAYEMFLSGAAALLTIENPNAKTDKELILFRDSFGSSIAPLFIEAYSKITLVDIRYIRSDILSEYIEFKNQDVLFLYSTLVLNDSFSLK